MFYVLILILAPYDLINIGISRNHIFYSSSAILYNDQLYTLICGVFVPKVSIIQNTKQSYNAYSSLECVSMVTVDCGSVSSETFGRSHSDEVRPWSHELYARSY